MPRVQASRRSRNRLGALRHALRTCEAPNIHSSGGGSGGSSSSLDSPVTGLSIPTHGMATSSVLTNTVREHSASNENLQSPASLDGKDLAAMEHELSGTCHTQQESQHEGGGHERTLPGGEAGRGAETKHRVTGHNAALRESANSEPDVVLASCHPPLAVPLREWPVRQLKRVLSGCLHQEIVCDARRELMRRNKSSVAEGDREPRIQRTGSMEWLVSGTPRCSPGGSP